MPPGCAENEQRLHCPGQIGREHLDRQGHYHILQKSNAIGDVLNSNEDILRT